MTTATTTPTTPTTFDPSAFAVGDVISWKFGVDGEWQRGTVTRITDDSIITGMYQLMERHVTAGYGVMRVPQATSELEVGQEVLVVRGHIGHETPYLSNIETIDTDGTFSVRTPSGLRHWLAPSSVNVRPAAKEPTPVEEATEEAAEGSDLCAKFPVGSKIAWLMHGRWGMAEVRISEDGRVVSDGGRELVSGGEMLEGYEELVALPDYGAITVDTPVRIARTDLDERRLENKVGRSRSMTGQWIDVELADGTWSYSRPWWRLDVITEAEYAEAKEAADELARLRREAEKKMEELAKFKTTIRRMAFEAKANEDYCGELENFLDNIGLGGNPEYEAEVQVTVKVRFERDWSRPEYLEDEVITAIQGALEGMDHGMWDSVETEADVTGVDVELA